MNDKKPKVGEVVGWTVWDTSANSSVVDSPSREKARDLASKWNSDTQEKPYRIAKIVLSK